MMADEAFDFSLIGIDGLIAKLESVAGDVKLRGGRFALRKAAQIVRDRAKAEAMRLDDPATAANIAANIVERWDGRRYKRTGDIGFRIGVMGGAGGNREGAELAGLPGGDTRHWRYLEFGSEKMAAQPFMRKALAQSVGAVTNEFITQYERALDRAIKRAAKAAQQ